MNAVTALIKRNVKLFFKDKGMFFSSLITPIILLVLYATFLSGIYKDSFYASLPEGTEISERLISGLAAGQLFASLLAVSSVTVAFCANFLVVQDKVTGARKDMLVSPVNPARLSVAYYLSAAISSLIICFAAVAVSFVYIAAVGWYLSFADVLLIILDVFILVMFGTALSSVINYFLTTQGQISAVGTVISAGYGFICGAYMPIYSFGEGLRNAVMFLPGTYGTSLLRNHAMRGALSSLEAEGVPAAAINALKDGVDINLYFFGSSVEPWVMYLVLCASVALFAGIFILINKFSKAKK